MSQKKLSDLHPDHRWKLYIDEKQHDAGKHAFEKMDPGHAASMEHMLETYVATGQSETMDADLYFSMHAEMIGRMHRDGKTSRQVKNSTGTYNSYIIGRPVSDATREALSNITICDRPLLASSSNNEELDEKPSILEINNANNIISVIVDHEKDVKLHYRSDTAYTFDELELRNTVEKDVNEQSEPEENIQNNARFVPKEMHTSQAVAYNIIFTAYSPDDRKKLVQGVFDNYYNSIESAKNDRDKLEAIATAVISLQVMHSFPDGNGRLNGFILTNKLLTEQGFSPLIFPGGPRVIAGSHTPNELADIMKRGMEAFSAEARSYPNNIKLSESLTSNEQMDSTANNMETFSAEARSDQKKSPRTSLRDRFCAAFIGCWTAQENERREERAHSGKASPNSMCR